MPSPTTCCTTTRTPTGAIRRARRPTRCIAGARAALADFLGAGADEIVVRREHDDPHLPPRPRPRPRLGRGRRDRGHRARPSRQRRPLARPRARAGGDHPGRPASSPRPAQLDWPALERSLSARTRLLAIGAASNALGTVNDVTRACALARAAGALSFVDAVHYAPHGAVDVRRIGCDFLACSAYKFYGPHVGVLFGRRDRIEALDAPKLAPAPNARARAPRDRHAQPRGHRGRRRGGRLPRVAGDGRRPPRATARNAWRRCTSGDRGCSSGCGRGWSRSAG